jgi:hypothetical protein
VRIVTSTGAIPPRIILQNSLFQLYSVVPKLSIIPLPRPLRWELVRSRISIERDRSWHRLGDYRAQVCVPTTPYQHRQNMSDWCQANCIRIPSNCPPGICHCLWVLSWSARWSMIRYPIKWPVTWTAQHQLHIAETIVYLLASNCALRIFQFSPFLSIRRNTCDAIGDIADKPGADQYCLRQCMRYPSNCPIDRCNCY